jgi:DNA-binding transcriptional ArsR family regulator
MNDHHVDAVLAALAHPVRRRMVSRLMKGEATVTELGTPFDLTQPVISHHVKVLEEAGLVRHRVDGNRRPRRLSPEGWDSLDAWVDTVRTAYEANYDRLDGLLESLQKEDKR